VEKKWKTGANRQRSKHVYHLKEKNQKRCGEKEKKQRIVNVQTKSDTTFTAVKHMKLI